MLPDTEYQPSWYEARIAGQKGAEEKSAAIKASLHSNTPTVVHLDPLNRPFLTVVDNGPGGNYSTRTVLDITGNAVSTTDAMGRIAGRCTYNMLGHRIYKGTMDSGERWSVFDVSSKQIYEWDSRGQRFRSFYDALRRDIESNLQKLQQPEIKVWMKIYGETQQDGAVHNQRGKVFRVFDQGGVETYLDYDFKGNLIASERQLALEYKANLDWSGAVPLESTTFLSNTQYDALNRVI
jgi:YD repeat-containing protein